MATATSTCSAPGAPCCLGHAFPPAVAAIQHAATLQRLSFGASHAPPKPSLPRTRRSSASPPLRSCASSPPARKPACRLSGSRAGLPGSAFRHQVRRLLPRPRRRSAGKSRQLASPPSASPAPQVCRPRPRCIRSRCRTTTSAPWKPPSLRTPDLIACVILEPVVGNAGTIARQRPASSRACAGITRNSTARCSSSTKS